MRIVVEVAKSSSGKDAILNRITELYPNIKTIVSYTSRPIRENEVEGITYHYISDEKAKQMLDNNEFIETRIYDTVHGKWIYGVGKSSFDLNSDDVFMVILDLNGLKQLKEYLSENNKLDCLTSVYIKASGKIRLLRSLQRESNLSDKQCEEICRRYIVDEEDMLKAEDYCDYVINNDDNFQNAVNRVIDILENIIQKENKRMELNTNELREIALGLNLLASERNVYLLDDSNEKYKEKIEEYLKLDNDLIRKVTNEIKRLKEEEC